MTRETMTENEIADLVKEIRTSLDAMRKARLLTRNAIMSHIGKNNAVLRAAAITLDTFGFEVGDTKETRRLMIWNEYLKMELERVTGVAQEVRQSAMLTAKVTSSTRIKQDNNAAVAAFLAARK